MVFCNVLQCKCMLEKELKKQSKKEKPSQKESDLGKKSSNPYATLLEESGVPTTIDQQNTALKKSKKRRSSYYRSSWAASCSCTSST